MKNEIIYEKKVKNLHLSIDISDVRVCLKKCRIIRINTSAWGEEDFYLYTNLTKEQIGKVVKPILRKDRENGDITTNLEVVMIMRYAYPFHIIEFNQQPDFLSF